MTQGKTAVEGSAARTARIRALMQKGVVAGLTPSESAFLQGELGRMAARVARVNARLGIRAVEISPFAGLIGDRGGSAVVTV